MMMLILQQLMKVIRLAMMPLLLLMWVEEGMVVLLLMRSRGTAAEMQVGKIFCGFLPFTHPEVILLSGMRC